jgi:putative SOS response-associated peptidase YedK
MCGRYDLNATPRMVEAVFANVNHEDFPPRYNIAPTQPVAVVRLLGGRRHLSLMRWGLVPAWVEDPRAFSLLVNARAETAAERPAFNGALRYRRCLFPATGFYEWQRGPGGRKQPYWIRPRSERLIALAGLWETWSDRNGGEVDTACILTTSANATVAPIHDRMPVIIAPADFNRWLASTGDPADDIGDLMRPPPDDLLEAVPVSDRVNDVDNDGPELQEPVLPGEAERQLRLF